ncbi:hypothetical protein Q2E61_14245 [Microbulbifer thermotolerans]|uniref:hypothetical protein n=1 Tax=Microbulbifer thermotolerans TaxID=252514 RepID=UPI0026732D8E|nr:hypothetical protein [Microbulbifer thermotolerans]WKT60054.1 hypothetical protein Q2E61_14245 [Microbulbifer thermotolerans]
MTKLKTLLFLSLALVAGCTNVTSDAARSVYPVTGSSLNTKALFSAASEFFGERSYRCDHEREGGILRCYRKLRDLYIHQTRAEVMVLPDDEVHVHTLYANRWDEGLIPGELISKEYTNPDVLAFCEHLKAQALGECRLQPESG